MAKKKKAPQVQTRPIARVDAEGIAQAFLSDSRDPFQLAVYDGAQPSIIKRPDDVEDDNAMEDAIQERVFAAIRPALVEALYREGNRILGYPVDDDFPRYQTASWELLPGDRDGTVEELEAALDRARANLRWFFTHHRESFGTEEVAELISVRPSDVHQVARQTYAYEVLDERGRYPREIVFGVATKRCAWLDADIVSLVFNAGGTADAVNDAPLEQLSAIRSFFTNPKDSYNAEELRAIFGDRIDAAEVLDGDEVAVRDCVGGYMGSYISPVVVGRTVADFPPSPLTLKTITVTLPAWQVDELERSAAVKNDTVSDALAMELESVSQGLLGFAAVRPNYATVLAEAVASADRAASAISETVAPQRAR